jgi:hypothetical protein
MFNHAPDTLFRLYASVYVPLTLSDQGFDPRQEADLERHLAAEARRPRLSAIAYGTLAALALVFAGAAGIGGF